ncbi:MAG: coagulation factor 5/8 type domain-containing protein [Verrucomicrobia bacterium]|nr:coagulation factor 5/8 type domain-containing protein [Verrucomicrobiota bacterium]
MKPLAFPTAAHYIFPRIHHMKLPGCLIAVLFPVITVCAADPDFGPNVLVLDPSTADAQERVHAVFKQQERAQFGLGRHAFLLKPGRYTLDMPIGFFTHIAGLGKLPREVTIDGGVWTDAAWMRHNATCNFWRTVENLTIEPPGGTNLWAVSQAAPLRRAHIKGDLHLSSAGWSSGGFMADCRIDGVVRAGSQQQWFSRNSAWKKWDGLNWNMVFLGCQNAPEGDWPEKAVTRIDQTPIVREKPYLTIENGHWFVRVPPLLLDGASGLSWSEGAVQAEPIHIDKFHIAKAGIDTSTTINAALQAGKHLLVTPGIYPLDDTVVISRPGTVVLGLGLPSLVPTTGRTALRVESGEGVIVSGLVVDAGAIETEVLVQFGLPGRNAGSAGNPTCIHDLVCRVGGYGPGRARLMVAIHDSHVIGDNLWLWRADHGANVGWSENTCDTGLRVEGDDVTIYGLFVEHTQKHQTLWSGERGRVFFYQSEMPYDPPSQEAWRSPSGDGYASYKVADTVQAHEAWGFGVYHVFQKAAVIAENAFETPASPGIQMHHLVTVRLGGGKTGSGIRNVINGTGGEVITSQKAKVK